MINSKFNCTDKVWFWNVNKPISRFIYQVSEIDNVIWYVLTPKICYLAAVPFYVDEAHLYSSKKECLMSAQMMNKERMCGKGKK